MDNDEIVPGNGTTAQTEGSPSSQTGTGSRLTWERPALSALHTYLAGGNTSGNADTSGPS